MVNRKERFELQGNRTALFAIEKYASQVSAVRENAEHSLRSVAAGRHFFRGIVPGGIQRDRRKRLLGRDFCRTMQG